MGRYFPRVEKNHGRIHMKEGRSGAVASGKPCKQCRYCLGIWEWEEDQLVQ